MIGQAHVSSQIYFMTTTGLIIAAGAGTRLADGRSIPKPLRKVLGVPLLKRIVFLAHRGGLKKIYVVVGFQKEKIINYVRSQNWPVEIEFIENPDWKKSNGVSVLMAKDYIREDFILLMSDHIFDFKTLEKLRSTGLGQFQAKLAVDFKVHLIFDKDDATKVQVEGDKITAINKNLVTYNAIDTGMFLLSPTIFNVLEAVKKDGDCSLSDGIRGLAADQKMGIMDIGEADWQDVDTPDSLKHAEKILLESCRKDTDGFISRNFNRHVSLFLSRFLAKTPLTANVATFFITCFGVLSGYFASQGTYATFLIAAFLFKWTSILDGVDGELAKLKFTASKFGQWFDTLSDNVTYVIFTFGTMIGLYKRAEPGINVIGPAACFGMVMLLAVMYFYILRFTNSGSLLAVQQDFVGKEQTWWRKIFVKMYFVIKRDFFATLFLFLAFADKPLWILFLIALATNIAWMVVVSKVLPRLVAKK